MSSSNRPCSGLYLDSLFRNMNSARMAICLCNLVKLINTVGLKSLSLKPAGTKCFDS